MPDKAGVSKWKKEKQQQQQQDFALIVNLQYMTESFRDQLGWTMIFLYVTRVQCSRKGHFKG